MLVRQREQADEREPGDFVRLWSALTVSLVGSQITTLALPLLAAIRLDASALEMGVLATAGQAPFFLFSLPAGAWVDRVPRRPLLIGSDIASCVLLLSVPLAVLFGGPGFLQLCAVAFGVGTMAVVSEVAHYAYVPSLVERDRLTEFNSKLQVSYSAAEAAGPALAGTLVQLLSAPIAVVADAATFLISASLLRRIRHLEQPVTSPDGGLPVHRSILVGMRSLLGHPLLRAIIVASVPITFFTSGFLAIYVLYATRELGLVPASVGVIFAAGGVSSILGAVISGRAAKRFGVGPTMIGGWMVAASAALMVPFAAGSTIMIVGILASAKAVEGVADTVANIHQWSLRQAVTPDHLAGRVTAGHRFTVYGAGAIGALFGGALGSLFGLRIALLCCATGALLSPLLALFSPLRHLREQPASSDLEAA